MSRFNLDAIAGQNRAEQVEQAVRQAQSMAWADPQSLHFEGKQAAQLLEVSRESVAKAIGVERERVAFAASTADAVAQVISAARPQAVLYLSIERQAVTDAIAESARDLEFAIESIGVDSAGQANLADLEQAIATHKQNGDAAQTGATSVLVFAQWANQEIGAVQDLAKISQITQAAGAKLAVDASAALGFVPLYNDDAGKPYWDFLFADSAGWAGSRMATVVASAGRAPLADTTSVAEAATAAVSLETLRQAQPAESERLTALRAKLETSITEQFPQVDLVDPGPNRLPHVVTFSLPYVDAEALAVELDRQGVAIGSGSACANDVGVPSHVLAAIGSLTQGNVRVSLPIGCEEQAIDRLLELLPDLVDQLGADITAPAGTPEPAQEAGGETEAATTPADAVHELDERGQLCPHPVIELAKAAKRLGAGATISVITDDPAALTDIPAWARLQGAEIVSQESTENDATRFVLKLS